MANVGRWVKRLKPTIDIKSHGKSNINISTIEKNEEINWIEDCYRNTLIVCFAQISANKGVQTYDKISVVEIIKGYTNLDNLTVFGVDYPDALSKY